MTSPSSSTATAFTLVGSVTSISRIRVCQSVQLGSRIWITTSRLNLPTIGQTLSGELQPESPIGTCDQSVWHRILLSSGTRDRMLNS